MDATAIKPAASWLDGGLRGGGPLPRQGLDVASALEQLSSEGCALFWVGREVDPPACPVEHHLPLMRATPLGIGPDLPGERLRERLIRHDGEGRLGSVHCG